MILGILLKTEEVFIANLIKQWIFNDFLNMWVHEYHPPIFGIGAGMDEVSNPISSIASIVSSNSRIFR